MEKFYTLNDAKALAKFAHFKQKDKAGFDYYEHPKSVLAMVQAQGAAPYVQIAAVFHDVTEDTAFTPEILLALGFSEAAVNLVKLLDRDYSEVEWCASGGAIGLVENSQEYKDARDAYYYAEIAKVPEAKMIKLADIRHNTLPWRTVYLSPERQKHGRAKYDKALRLLGE